jgi:hypothetical protein
VDSSRRPGATRSRTISASSCVTRTPSSHECWAGDINDTSLVMARTYVGGEVKPFAKTKRAQACSVHVSCPRGAQSDAEADRRTSGVHESTQ